MKRLPDPRIVERSVISAPFVAVLLGVASSAATAQEASIPGFDLDRAWVVDTTMFEPFLVRESVPLRDVLDRGTVTAESPVLVMEHPSGVLALSTEQMAYHHSAQGRFDDEPWAVSF